MRELATHESSRVHLVIKQERPFLPADMANTSKGLGDGDAATEGRDA